MVPTPFTNNVLRHVSSPSMQIKSLPSSPRSFYSVSGTISSHHTLVPSSDATPTTPLGSAWSDNHAKKPLPAQPGPDDIDLEDEIITPARSFLDLHPSSFTPFIGLPNIPPVWESGLLSQRNNSSAKTALSAREVQEMKPLPVLLARVSV